jgi:low affinity Fe/Cu permease
MSRKEFHSEFLEKLSRRISHWSGSSIGFACASTLILVWLITGPIMRFSAAWQLFINTTTTTITFLMVFLIQRAEQKHAQALHLKLNAIMEKLGIDKALLDVEHTREQKLDALEDANKAKAKRAKKTNAKDQAA